MRRHRSEQRPVDTLKDESKIRKKKYDLHLGPDLHLGHGLHLGPTGLHLDPRECRWYIYHDPVL